MSVVTTRMSPTASLKRRLSERGEQGDALSKEKHTSSRRRGRRGWGTAAALLVVLVIGLTQAGNVTLLSVLTMALIYSIAVGSLDLVVGFTGLLSVGQAGLVGVGAYTVALLEAKYALPMVLALLVAGLVAVMFGGVLGLCALRLKGHYFTLVTLAFGLAVPQLALNASSLTNGDTGVVVDAGTFFGLSTAYPLELFEVVFIVAAICFLFLERFLFSTLGRKAMAVRDDELAAKANGISVYSTRLAVFGVSSFLAGISGGLLAYFVGLVAPSSLPFDLSLFFLAALIVGGSGRYTLCFAGSVVGAVLLAVLKQATVSNGSLAEVIFGGAVIVAVVLSGRGIWSLVQMLTAVPSQRGWLRRVRLGKLRTSATESGDR